MAWLRRLPVRKLRRHHRPVFPEGHQFHRTIPGWVPRYRLERRLYFYYAAVHYHLPDPYRREFRKKARAVLTEPFDTFRQDFEDQLWADLRTLRRWLADRTIDLDDKQVSRIPCILGYAIKDGTPDMER